MDINEIYTNLTNVVNKLLAIPDINAYKTTNKDDLSSLVISIITFYNQIQSSNNTEFIHNAFLLLNDLVNKKPELTDIKELIVDSL